MASPVNLNVGKLTVKDIMTEKVTMIQFNSTVREGIKLLVNQKISGAPVVEVGNTLLTVISEFDFAKFAAKGGMDSPISDYLKELPSTKNVVTVNKKDSFRDLFKKFLLNPVRRVIVVNDYLTIEGVVARRDILKAFIEASSEQQKTLSS